MNDTTDQKNEVAAPEMEPAAETQTEVAQDSEQAADEQAALRAEVERLREDLRRAQDQLLRKAAEFQNYRRRTEEEKQTLVQIGKGAVIEQLLDVVDDFARTVEATKAEGATVESIGQGIDLVYQKLMGELEKVGVVPIEAIGHPFDENEHDALMRQPAPEGTQPGTVIEEIQRGYRMDDRVLRHARVVVATESE